MKTRDERDGVGFFGNVLQLLCTPVMIGATAVAGLAVAMHGFVQIAQDRKSGETTCVEDGSNWDDTFGNCDMP
jgi:hypothetical protein